MPIDYLEFYRTGDGTRSRAHIPGKNYFGAPLQLDRLKRYAWAVVNGNPMRILFSSSHVSVGHGKFNVEGPRGTIHSGRLVTESHPGQPSTGWRLERDAEDKGTALPWDADSKKLRIPITDIERFEHGIVVTLNWVAPTFAKERTQTLLQGF